MDRRADKPGGAPTLKIDFIVNPKAGWRFRLRDRIAIIEKAFSKGKEDYRIQVTRGRGDATRMARQAVEAGTDLVVAVGGDGTVNEVASSLIHTPATLGVIPVGSGNVLAREFGIPLNIKRACQVLKSGQTRQIDVGKIGERYFLTVAGTGLDAYVVKRYDEKSRWRGILPYFYLTFLTFFQYKPQEVRLRLPDQEIVTEPLLVAFANIKRIGGWIIIAPEARPDDGLLDVCILKNLSFGQALRCVPSLFTGKLMETSALKVYQVDHLEVIKPAHWPYQVDGEPVLGSSCLSVSLLPGALRLRCP